MAYEAALAALSDPTRRLVFERILAAPRPVTAIAEGLPVSRPADRQECDGSLRAGAGIRAVCRRFRALVAGFAGPHRPRPGGLCDRAARRRPRLREGGRWARNGMG